MKLSRRIVDLVRASLAAPPKVSGLGKERSPKRLEAQLEHIRKSLVQATGREKRLQEELAIAEQEGRERDAVRLRRELADLTRSGQELQAALDLIEARIEMERQSQAEPGPATSEGSPLTEEAATPHASLADADGQADLTARKTRLAAPDEKRGTTGTH